MHPGRGPGLNSRLLGEVVGTETVTLQETQIASHNHGFMGNLKGGDETSPIGGVFGIAPDDVYTTEGASVNMSSNILANTGGNAAHNNMQPYLAMNFIIAMTGLYPSRS